MKINIDKTSGLRIDGVLQGFSCLSIVVISYRFCLLTGFPVEIVNGCLQGYTVPGNTALVISVDGNLLRPLWWQSFKLMALKHSLGNHSQLLAIVMN